MNRRRKRIHPALLPAHTPENAARLLFRAKDGAFVVTLNLELLARTSQCPAYSALLQKAEYRICDGIGGKLLLWLQAPFATVPRIAGIDLGNAILSLAAAQKTPVFLLGGKPGIAKAARKRLITAHPRLRVVGTAHGYHASDELPALRGRIRSSGAEILFVCMGSPKQEEWIAANRRYLPSVRLFLPLGGSLDVWSGTLSRAPHCWQAVGLEWLWRLLHQPQRIGRLVSSLSVFVRFSSKNRQFCFKLNNSL